jgi:hypothetical protein
MSTHARAATTWVAGSVAAIFLIAMAMFGLAGPAFGGAGILSGDDISFSLDGESYSESLDGALVPNEAWLSPGVVERVSLWIRNDSRQPRDVSVDLALASSAFGQRDLLASRALGLSARIDNGDWRTRRLTEEPRSLVVGTIAPGSAAQLEVRVAMAPDVQGRISGRDLDLSVALDDAPGVPLTSRLLPAVSPLTSVLIPVGLLIVAAGALLANRRESHSFDESFAPRRRRPVTAVAVDDYAPVYEDALR